jgi:hypothetical protein
VEHPLFTKTLGLSMYTIDELIQRLQELRTVAKQGGETPVVINESDSESEMENIACELQKARVITTSAVTGKPVGWIVSRVSNDCEVVRVF